MVANNKGTLGVGILIMATLQSCTQMEDLSYLISRDTEGNQSTTELTGASARRLADVLIHETISSENLAIARAKGFGNGLMIYSNHFDANNDGIFDGPNANLDWWINQISNPATFDGYISIDWEGPGLDALDAGDLGAREQYLIFLRYLKSRLPNAHIGYYGFPKVNYWECQIEGQTPCQGATIIGDDHHSLVDRVNTHYRPILEESTAWFPSLYQFYPASTYPNTRTLNLQYVRWNTTNILRMRGDRDIPIYNTVWPDWHECCTSLPNYRIPSEEFVEQLRENLDASYNGRHIEGLYWWGADRYALQMLRETAPNLRATSPYRFIIAQCGSDPAGWEPCLNRMARQTIDDFYQAITESAL